MNDARLKEPGGQATISTNCWRASATSAPRKSGFIKKSATSSKPTSVDYEGGDATCQNLLRHHPEQAGVRRYGQTAAELILSRADPAKPNMALTAWKGERVRKGDVTVSKNYLDANEIASLNRLTTMFLDFAEDRASRRIETRMADWIAQTDRFLAFNERDVLRGAGGVSHERMEEIAHQRFAEFDASRRAVEAAEAEAEALDDIEQLQREARKLRKPELP